MVIIPSRVDFWNYSWLPIAKIIILCKYRHGFIEYSSLQLYDYHIFMINSWDGSSNFISRSRGGGTQQKIRTYLRDTYISFISFQIFFMIFQEHKIQKSIREICNKNLFIFFLVDSWKKLKFIYFIFEYRWSSIVGHLLQFKLI